MPLHLTIVTPEGEAFDGDVEQVVLPGTEGDFGVLEQHERFLAPLRLGAVEIKTNAGSEWSAISGGFADVSAEHTVVLVDSYYHSEHLDLAHLDRELERAREELRSLGGSPEEEERRGEIEDAIVRDTVLREVAGRR